MPQGLLEGKHGVVLGVANEKSIAWGCAQACAHAGARLTFNYPAPTFEKRVRKLAETLENASAYPCDVTDDGQIREFFEQVRQDHGKLDFVIHSVAYAEREDLKNPFVETPRRNFQRALDVSAYSLVAVAREAAALMEEGGSIAAMTYYGSEKVIPNYNVMGVAKAALEASARYLAHDLGPRGIRVNCISAGPLPTLSASAISGMRRMLELTEKNAPLRRNVTQEDVANAAVYLVSDLSTAVTGELLHVDSGFNILGMGGESAPREA